MTKGYRCPLNNVEGAHFFRASNEVSLKEINNLFYSGLDPLINLNRSITQKYSSKGTPAPDHLESERDKLYQEIVEEVRNVKGLTTLLTFEDDSKEHFDLKARTNFRSELTKRPNIVYLTGGENETLVLREARNYGENPLVHKDARGKFSENYKENIPLTVDEKNSASEPDIFSIPEPLLVLGLEQIHNDLDISRITPRIKVVGLDGNNLYYLRNTLMHIRDGPLSAEGLMNYQGTLNGLGLMDVLDNQIAHYCLNGDGTVVNIDPDFFAYTNSQKHIENFDLGSFKDEVGKECPEIKNRSNGFNKIRRVVLNNVLEKMGGLTLLDYISQNIKDSPILDKISTRQVRE